MFTGLAAFPMAVVCAQDMCAQGAVTCPHSKARTGHGAYLQSGMPAATRPLMKHQILHRLTAV